jgi:hypothetical protein
MKRRRNKTRRAVGGKFSVAGSFNVRNVAKHGSRRACAKTIRTFAEIAVFGSLNLRPERIRVLRGEK